MKLALLLCCQSVAAFVPHALHVARPWTSPAAQAVVLAAGGAAAPKFAKRRGASKAVRRARLQTSLESTPTRKMPDGPDEDDPATPMALAAAGAADDRKAREIVALRVGHLTSATNYFVNMQGTSRAQIDAIVKSIEDVMLERFEMVGSRQGKASSGWVCVDYESIVVNVFSPEEREFYALEKFWAAAPQLDLSGVISPSTPGDDSGVDEWALEGAADDEDDDWSLGADDWALSGGDDWSLSSAEAGESPAEWSMGGAEDRAEEWSSSGALDDEDKDDEDREVSFAMEEEEEAEEGEEDWALGDASLRALVDGAMGDDDDETEPVDKDETSA